jgi:hypothetical protein
MLSPCNAGAFDTKVVAGDAREAFIFLEMKRDTANIVSAHTKRPL